MQALELQKIDHEKWTFELIPNCDCQDGPDHLIFETVFPYTIEHTCIKSGHAVIGNQLYIKDIIGVSGWRTRHITNLCQTAIKS